MISIIILILLEPESEPVDYRKKYGVQTYRVVCSGRLTIVKKYVL